jgi:flavin reductase (DIM6/NTAB) family NADH-FMN oxidoreductase RutF
LANRGKIERANMINSLSGYKPANLIGTISKSKKTNLAIFSSGVNPGTTPPLFGFITRPTTEVLGHTYENIKEIGVYTINHSHESFVEKAHYTSTKFDRETSEFAAYQLTEEYLEGFDAPFVKEIVIKRGLKFAEEIHIKLKGTILIIGEIQHLILPENARLEDGNVELYAAGEACISELDSCHAVKEAVRFPFARPSNVPEFKTNQKTT